MGFCLSCCKSTEPSYTSANTPSEEERRKKMSEAAEKRLREQDQRGLRDAQAVKRIELARERSNQVEEAFEKPETESKLRWQVS